MHHTENDPHSQVEQIPQAPEAERAILSILLVDQALFDVTRRRLRPEHFFVRSNRKMYEALFALADRGISFDPVQLIEQLRQSGELDYIGGGPGAVSVLFETGAVRSDLDNAIASVIETAEKRHLWTALMEGARLANNGHTPAQVRERVLKAIEAEDNSLNSLNSHYEPEKAPAQWPEPL